jgi:hypothetical protein
MNRPKKNILGGDGKMASKGFETTHSGSNCKRED